MSASPSITNDPTLERLDDQIIWYGRKSTSHKKYFYALKMVTLVAGAAIPLLPVLLLDEQFSRIVTAVLGVVIVVIEGIQQLYQLQTNWITYRSTCESLKHEKYLFLADAGPYAVAQKPHSLLAERIETLVSQEHVKWISVQSISQRASQSSIDDQNEKHQPAPAN
jgi:Protein of unknown function (DUF4231)